MYNIHCQWHPLKTCIVGRTYDPSFFENTPAADKIAKVCEETEEDLQSLITILKQFNVEVIRPQIDITDRFENYDRKTIPRPPIAPRDSLVVIGNKIFEFGNDHPSIRACVSDTKKSIFSAAKDVLNLPAPSITQLGKDILVDERCFNRWEMQWIEKQLPDYRINKISIGGHNDGSFIILKPGVILSMHNTVDWNTHFSGWKVFESSSDKQTHCKQWLIDSKINQGKWWIPGQEDDTELASFVDQWLNRWTGFAAETVFSINALMLDEKHVVINIGQNRDDIVDFLEENGITPIVCPQRHQYFWDNGIHCMTLDLNREGEMFNLFPNRDSPFICKGY